MTFNTNAYFLFVLRRSPTNIRVFHRNDGMPVREFFEILLQTIEHFGGGDEEIVVQLLNLINSLP